MDMETSIQVSARRRNLLPASSDNNDDVIKVLHIDEAQLSADYSLADTMHSNDASHIAAPPKTEPCAAGNDDDTSATSQLLTEKNSKDKALNFTRLGIKRRYCGQRVGNMTVLLWSKDGDPVLSLGPDRALTILTAILIAGASHIVITRAWSMGYHYYICWAFTLVTLASFGMSSLYDPGVVLPGSSRDGTNRRFLCDICNILQRPDVDHCTSCGVCLEEMDHHCPWIGKFVASGNFIWFVVFSASWLLYLVYVGCLAYVYYSNWRGSKAMTSPSTETYSSSSP